MIKHPNLKKPSPPIPELILWRGTPINLVGFAVWNGRVICGHIGETDETVLVDQLREKTRKRITGKVWRTQTFAAEFLRKIPEVQCTVRWDLPSGKIFVSPCGCQLTAASRRLIQLVTDYFLGRRCEFSGIPLDLGQGTEFARRVWQQCRSIPGGATITYGELAMEIGRPRAVRAVAQALARNPIPILIPCHRVIGADGSLCGFSAPGGTDTKRKLLLMEREFYATCESRTQWSS